MSVVSPVTAGAANVGDAVSAPDIVVSGPEVWFHEYVMVWPSGSYDAVPFSVTMSPGRAVWSGPALAMGGLFGRVDMLTGWDIPDSPWPFMAMMRKAYAVPGSRPDAVYVVSALPVSLTNTVRLC